MISFTCPTCGKHFTVPDAYAGRAARCKGCGAALKVPAAANPGAPAGTGTPPGDPKLSPRARRLLADAELLKKAFEKCEHIRIASFTGDPPDQYEIEYRVNSLERGGASQPRQRSEHRVRISLTSDYPRLCPQCSMLTPIFHPNINETTICVGDHWTAGERLVDLVIRIAEMLAYQAYNIRSPLDGEAAMWADLNHDKLPTDPRDMRPAGLE